MLLDKGKLKKNLVVLRREMRGSQEETTGELGLRPFLRNRLNTRIGFWESP